MAKNPLAEVFGFSASNMSDEAVAYREGRLCPYHNSSGLNCTKNSATNPLGVCTVHDGEELAIICPVRFREDYLIVADAAHFFFPPKSRYIALTEARLNDKNGKSAGNIDIVLAVLDENDQITDFGALEVQAVYISGNIGKVFQEYMKNPEANHDMDWPRKNYPTPDYLSSSRKRLAPQLIYKGGILNAWNKKMAVAVHSAFFNQLPTLPEVEPTEADIAWLIYDIKHDISTNRYKLTRTATRYTKFKDALDRITMSEAGNEEEFLKYLSERIRKGKIMGSPPEAELPPAVEPLPNIFVSNSDDEVDSELD